MYHDRRRFFAVAGDVKGAEALRQIEVDLGRAALPIATDRVAQYIFELRTVESAFARTKRRCDNVAMAQSNLVQHAAHHCLRMIPHRVGSHAFLGSGRELDLDFVKAEMTVDR